VPAEVPDGEVRRKEEIMYVFVEKEEMNKGGICT
jgi:hypothetical protein